MGTPNAQYGVWIRLGGLAGFFSVMACAETPAVRNRPEDVTRRIAPLPACIVALPPRQTPSIAVRTLREENYWKLVFPEFDLTNNSLPARALGCTGDPVLDDPQLAGGTPTGGWPLRVKEGDAVFGAGGDKLRLVWLRSHKFPDGTVGGALALTRVLEDYAEVYGIGVYRGHPEKTRLQLERMGEEVLATAQDEGCVARAPGSTCETRLKVFVARRGTLHPIADLALEKVAFTTNSEPGILGRIEYHLTTTPKYLPTGMKVLEQVQVNDEKGRPLRKAELERVLSFMGDKAMAESDDPLWPRVFPASKPGAKPEAKEPTKNVEAKPADGDSSGT